MSLINLFFSPRNTTNPISQLLPKEEDLPVRDLRKWKIFPKRKIKDLYQKAIKSEAVSL